LSGRTCSERDANLSSEASVFAVSWKSLTKSSKALTAWRRSRYANFSLLIVGLPGLILMRRAGEWLYRLQNWDDLPEQLDEPAWLRIGMLIANWGGLLFLLALALGGVGVHRLRQGKGGAGLLRATMVIAMLLIVASAVAVWAMTRKTN